MSLPSASRRLVAAAFFVASLAAYSEAFEEIDASLLDSVFSPYTFLSGLPEGFEAYASRVEAPSLAGPRLAALDEGLSANSAARLPDLFGTSFSLSPSIYGGYYDSALFGGAHLRGAIANYGLGLGYFAAADLGAEYDYRFSATPSASTFSGAAAAGLVGQFPVDYSVLPFVLAVRAALPSIGEVPELSLLFESVNLTNFIGQARFFTFSGFGLDAVFNDSGFGGLEFFARVRATIEKRRYVGALFRGWSAYVGGEVRTKFEADSPLEGWTSLGLRLGTTYKRWGGIQSAFRFRYSTTDLEDWGASLRCLTVASRATVGNLGLGLSLDFPFILARGLLFRNENGACEFFLKPYLDMALVDPFVSPTWFSLEKALLSGGLELAMTIDKDRKQAFHLAAGIDATRLLRSGTALGPSDIVIEGGFRYVYLP